jgi:hypothetical protein
MDFTKKAILAARLVGLLSAAARTKQDAGRKEN